MSNASKKENVSFEEKLSKEKGKPIAQLMFPIYKRFLEGKDIVKSVNKDLRKGNVNTPVEIYLSRVVGYSIGAGIGVGILSFILSLGMFTLLSGQPVLGNAVPNNGVAGQIVTDILNIAQYPIMSLFTSVLLGIVSLLSVFLAFVFYPKLIVSKRKKEINILLGDALAFMYSLSVGNTNQLDMMEAVAEADDTYGEVSVEFQQIIHEMTYFNVDYQTAMENAASRTPSTEFEGFLSDMLSVVNSGGEITSFLDTQQQMMRERSRRNQKDMLNTLETFGQIYLALNILPMGLLIVLVIVSMMANVQIIPLAITAYLLIPGLNILFIVMISTIKQDEVGSGVLKADTDELATIGQSNSLSSLEVVDYHKQNSSLDIFESVRSNEIRHRTKNIIQNPFGFLKLNPKYSLFATVPTAVLFLVFNLIGGTIALSPTLMVDQTYTQTVIWLYIPILIVFIPLSTFIYLNNRERGRITDSLTEDIRKLANANDTGLPVIEALKEAAEGESTRLSEEFKIAHKKAKFGSNLSTALVELNNKYKKPRLARVMKLIQKAQESSSNITDVLQTAAKTSQYQDELIEERKSRTRMQVGVIGLTFFVFLGIIVVIDSFLLDSLVGQIEGQTANTGLAGGGIQSIPTDMFSMIYFHSITIQAILGGLISGYVQTGRLESGYKYMIFFLIASAVGWGLFAA